MRILIAEDDPSARAMLMMGLRVAGYELLETSDGAAAWAELQKPDAPQLVVLDWMMPEMDGIEVVRRVRAIPTNQPPYIIMLTSKSGKSALVAGLETGANDYITKPFNMDELHARLLVGRRMVEMQATLNGKIAQLEFQTKFQQIAAQTSADLAAVADVNSLHPVINTALRQLGELFAADRSYLFRFSEDLAYMTNTHEWHVPAIPP